MIFKFVTYSGLKELGHEIDWSLVERPKKKVMACFTFFRWPWFGIFFLLPDTDYCEPHSAWSSYPPVFGLHFLPYCWVKAAGPCFPLAGKSCKLCATGQFYAALYSIGRSQQQANQLLSLGNYTPYVTSNCRLNTNPDPDPIRIQGFNDQKLKKKLKLKKNKQKFFYQKLQFTYP